MRRPTRPRPARSNAHVEGSGTGVKLSRRLLPEVERLNTPPFSGEVKPDELSVIAAGLKLTKLVAEAIDHE